jgi:predicted TIM-barrel fold metal-dependent hydrolase
MANDFSVVDAHTHVIPGVSGRNRFGALRSDRWGIVRRGNERLPMLPPTCADSSFPVEALVELMDREGVSQAVLLQNPTLGTCNEYVRECVERYPARFCGTIQVDPRAPDAVDVLRRFVSPKQNTLKLELSFDWGWTGLYPDLRIDEPGMRPLWEAVAELGMEVIIDPGPPGNPGYQVDAIDAISSRMTPTHFVLEHLGYLLGGQQSDAAAIAQRRQLLELAHKPNVWLGLSAVPILLDDDYPCHRSAALLREAVERVGARSLIWGSDGPITLNRHTYRQLVDTIRRGSDFLSEKEKRQILCDNAREVFRGLTIP